MINPYKGTLRRVDSEKGARGCIKRREVEQYQLKDAFIALKAMLMVKVRRKA